LLSASNSPTLVDLPSSALMIMSKLRTFLLLYLAVTSSSDSGYGQSAAPDDCTRHVLMD